MSSAVPLPLLGRDLSACTVFGGNADPVTGVITWATGVDIATAAGNASWKGFSIDEDRNGVDVSPSDAVLRTNLTETISLSFTLNEISPANGAGVLSGLSQSGYQFVKIVEAYRKRGNSAGPYYRGVMGRIGRIALPHDTGLNVSTLTGDTMGLGYVDGVTSLPSSFA